MLNRGANRISRYLNVYTVNSKNRPLSVTLFKIRSGLLQS